MSGIRVYEAARRLNIETPKLIAQLKERGVEVKSPIATITEEIFDGLLADLTTAPDKSGAPVARLTVVKDADSAHIPVAIAKTPEPKQEPPSPKKKKREPRKKNARPVAESSSESSPAVAPVATSNNASILAYVAIGLAAVALVVSLSLGSSVGRNIEQLARITPALKTALNNAHASQRLAEQNLSSLTTLETELTVVSRDAVRDDLLKEAAALKELSAGNSGAEAEALLDLARKMSWLSRSL